jgi:hypothetical protein
MFFRHAAALSLFLAASSGVALAQARTAGAPVITPVAGAPAVPNNGGGVTNPGIAPSPQPVAPSSGAGSSTNQATPTAGAQGSGGATNQANPARRVSRRQNSVANNRQTTVNQTGTTALDQTAVRRQGDMTEQRRNGTVNDPNGTTTVDPNVAQPQPAPVY